MTARLTVLFAVLIVLTGTGLAQTESFAAQANTWFVSGQMGLNFYTGGGGAELDTPNDGFDLKLVPRLLYFPATGIGVGGEANYNLYTNDNYTQSSLAIGPRFAYYLTNRSRRYPGACCLVPCIGPGGWWMPFVGLSALYYTSSYKSSGGEAVNTGSGYRVRAGLGISPLIGRRGSAILELGYEFGSTKQEGYAAQTSGRIYLEGGFGAFLFKDRK